MSTEYTFENKRDPQGSILSGASLGTPTTFLGPECIYEVEVSSWKPLRYRIAAAELPTGCHTPAAAAHTTKDVQTMQIPPTVQIKFL